MEPGEVYIADFLEAGPHPVIVVSREDLNRGHYVLVVVCSLLDLRSAASLQAVSRFRVANLAFWSTL